MSSAIRKFQSLASHAFKGMLPSFETEKAKHMDALLAGIADLLEIEEARKTTLADREEMAFGNPAFMMDAMGSAGPMYRDFRLPKMYEDVQKPRNVPTFVPFPPSVSCRGESCVATCTEASVPAEKDEGSSAEGPRLIIHETPPTVKVTKLDDGGTTLESLFLGMEPRGSLREAVEHESICSDDVGVDVESDEDDDDKLPLTCNGKNYFRAATNCRVYEAKDDGTPGEWVGVWINETVVPLKR